MWADFIFSALKTTPDYTITPEMTHDLKTKRKQSWQYCGRHFNSSNVKTKVKGRRKPAMLLKGSSRKQSGCLLPACLTGSPFCCRRHVPLANILWLFSTVVRFTRSFRLDHVRRPESTRSPLADIFIWGLVPQAQHPREMLVTCQRRQFSSSGRCDQQDFGEPSTRQDLFFFFFC